MPQGQACGHCRQPEHNVRTCEGYAKLMAVVEALEEARGQLREAELASIEDGNIIKFQAARIGQLRAAVQRLAEERDRLKALLGSFAIPSIGTGKGTSKHPDH